MLKELLEARNLPPLMPDGNWAARRQELIGLFSREEFGFTPPAPEKIGKEIRRGGNPEIADRAFGGKALQQVIRLSFDTPNGIFSFPFTLLVPRAVSRAPVFVHIAFRPDIPDRYLPAEEIIDRGYALANLYYRDITDDSGQWDGLAAMYPRDVQTGWGKIGMWAFAASRVMDYLTTREDIDVSRACVTGHSRLGKTALWCGAQDERFSMVISNESGCAGAALSRGKQGESVRRISDVFPYWFCGNYAQWGDREDAMPFDQHMLLALIAPRRLYVCSAEEDTWSDPVSEFLSCAAAGEAWEMQGMSGLVTPDALPGPGKPLAEGCIAYHLRTGTHFHSRTDWGFHLDYRDRFSV